MTLASEENERGFEISDLAFWKEKVKPLPKSVVLKVGTFKNKQTHTLLTIEALESDVPLDAGQRKRIFEQLGLLVK